MESGDPGGSDCGELEPIVSELAEAAREAHTELRNELLKRGGRVETDRADVDELRAELETTQQYVRKLEQYVVALEEQVDARE
jgi:hypothetical protein